MMLSRALLTLLMLCGSAASSHAQEFISIFDGIRLDGWRVQVKLDFNIR